MARVISVVAERFPIAGIFTISRGSKTEAEVITCTISEGGHAGRGECVPYKRYGETMEGVREAIETMRGRIADGIDRTALLDAMPAGAARNAIDCALWDLEAKVCGTPVANAIWPARPRALETAYTLSLGEPSAMAAQARANANRPLLKVKIGGDNDIARIQAVRQAAPESRIILDANEGWTDDNIAANLAFAAEQGIALIEQPLPAGRDGILRHIAHPVPICADESVHEARTSKRLSASTTPSTSSSTSPAG
ncbi:dipeptide epimerase [Mesorhizobium sp. ORM6]